MNCRNQKQNPSIKANTMKHFFTVILLCTTILSYSQPWFDIGLKGGVGSSFLYNKQIFDDQNLTHKFKPGYTFGGKFGFNFVQEHQLTFDAMVTTVNQGFLYYPEAGVEANREFGINTLDLLLMYRANKNGSYFEIGPQWSSVKKVTYTDNGGNFLGVNSPSDLIKDKYFSIALGVGQYIAGTDNFGITAGIRLNYVIDDMASDKGKEANFPVLLPKSSDPSHNISAMFVIELNYDFGYLVSPSCGKRGKLFVF